MFIHKLLELYLVTYLSKQHNRKATTFFTKFNELNNHFFLNLLDVCKWSRDSENINYLMAFVFREALNSPIFRVGTHEGKIKGTTSATPPYSPLLQSSEVQPRPSSASPCPLGFCVLEKKYKYNCKNNTFRVRLSGNV